jgi:hypothetical protein
MNNIFQQKYSEFTKAHTENSTQAATTNHADKAAQIFQDKPFSVEYAGLFTVAQIGQFIAQFVTLLSTAALVAFAIGHLLPAAGLFFALPVGIVVAMGIEVLKRRILAITAKNVIKYRQFGAVGFAALAAMLISVAAALLGSYELPAVLFPQTKTAPNTAAVERIAADIATLDADIQKAAMLPGWVAENRTVPRLQAQRTQLIQAREQAAQHAGTDAGQAAIDAEKTRQTKIKELQVYSVGTAISAELTFLLSTLFVFYFLWRCFAETQTAGTPDTVFSETHQAEKTHPTRSNGNRFGLPFSENKKVPQNHKKKPETVSVRARAQTHQKTQETQETRNTLRVCENCQVEYHYGHNRQRFCTDFCRVQNWQQRTGKTLKRYTIPAER